MKKLFKIMVLVIALMGAFFVGHVVGVHDHKMSQIIYNEDGTQGTYYSEYCGQVDEYYYEEGDMK